MVYIYGIYMVYIWYPYIIIWYIYGIYIWYIYDDKKSLIFWIWPKYGILKKYRLRRGLPWPATSSKSTLVKKFGLISSGTLLETGENGCTARHAFLDCRWTSRFSRFLLFFKTCTIEYTSHICTWSEGPL